MHRTPFTYSGQLLVPLRNILLSACCTTLTPDTHLKPKSLKDILCLNGSLTKAKDNQIDDSCEVHAQLCYTSDELKDRFIQMRAHDMLLCSYSHMFQT